MFEENPKFKGKGPKCDVCFPGVDLGNMDAWEVFQRYSCPMGPDSDAIMRLAERLGVSNSLETMEKVLDLLGAIENG